MKFLAAAARSSGRTRSSKEVRRAPGWASPARRERPSTPRFLPKRRETRRRQTWAHEAQPRKKPEEAARYRSSPRRLSSSSTSSSRRSRTTTTTTLSRCSFVFAFRRVPSSRRSSPHPTHAGPRPRPRRGPRRDARERRCARTKRPRLEVALRTSRLRGASRRFASARARNRAATRGTRRGVARRPDARRPPRRARARGVQRTPPSRARRGGRCGRPLLPRVMLCAHLPLRPVPRKKARESERRFFLHNFALRPSARRSRS